MNWYRFSVACVFPVRYRVMEFERRVLGGWEENQGQRVGLGLRFTVREMRVLAKV